MAHVLDDHDGEVVGATVHATGDFVATASKDKSWAFYDINRWVCVLLGVVRVGSVVLCCVVGVGGWVLGVVHVLGVFVDACFVCVLCTCVGCCVLLAVYDVGLCWMCVVCCLGCWVCCGVVLGLLGVVVSWACVALCCI